ncbi:hypothetical protein BDM02DRAFT_687220 [Thelephora ganbajun]|uniref:Uncharacterized protein n=1 Tax=Thelephora ganbajun TaxID=370292 RepID=A0ACB6Z6R2_THEGA|nr:hypothetical protein BDM02DRAFT_687220 [Thelephora ganbajun]
MEFFIWVLAYITVANIEYKDHTIKISPSPLVETWFRDHDLTGRSAHIMSKQRFHLEYGRRQRVSARCFRYLDVVRQTMEYWDKFHQSLKHTKHMVEPGWPTQTIQEPITREPEVDDPAGSLRTFIKQVEERLVKNSMEKGFTEGESTSVRGDRNPNHRCQLSCIISYLNPGKGTLNDGL